MWGYQAWKKRRALKRLGIADDTWRLYFARLPILRDLSTEEQARLKELAALFLHKKILESVGGLTLNDHMRLTIALQACLPILYLGLHWYNDWMTVLIYPEGFLAEQNIQDETGIIHRIRRPLSGEAWLRGPVILSWSGISDPTSEDGGNLIIHEFVHKLDMRDGAANGIPPLHHGMRVHDWTSAFAPAYDDLQKRVAHGLPSPIDPYAAEDPAEFFAVISEAFFEAPHSVKQLYPAVYQQLIAFYRQDPAERQAPPKRTEDKTKPIGHNVSKGT